MKDNFFKVFRELKSSVSKRTAVYIPVNTYSSTTGPNYHDESGPTDNSWPPPNQPPSNRRSNRQRRPKKKSNSSSGTLSAALNRFILFSSGKQRNQKNYVYLTLFIGLTAITLGVLLIIFSPYEIILKMKTTFVEDVEGFEMWRKPPANVYLKVYLFNVTNKDEFLAGTEKLNVQEVGPYIYREVSEHGKIIHHHKNATISMVPYYPLEWVPELNSGKEDDMLVLPNVALLSIANLAAPSFFMRIPINGIIRQTNTQPLVEQTVKEFMFGYKSALVTLGNQIFPGWIKFDKLGLIDRMYDFDGDVASVYSGEDDIRKSGLFSSYNNREYLHNWESPCNKLQNSSDGTKFPSLIKFNQSLLFYRKSLCRSMPVISKGEVSIINWLKTYHYKFPDNALDNGYENEENKCFCRKNRCLAKGLLDVQDCYYGFPIALSYPHFYQADPDLRVNVTGTNPDPKLHETFFNINPETGTPVQLAVRMQINMALQDVSSMTNAERFSHMVVPLLWTEVEMPMLPTALTVKLFLLLRVLPVVENVILYSSFICGVVFTVVSICSLTFTALNGASSSEKTSQHRQTPANKSIVRSKRTPSTNSKTNEDLDIMLECGGAGQLTVISDNEEADTDHRHIDEEDAENDYDDKDMDVYYCSILLPSSKSDEASL